MGGSRENLPEDYPVFVAVNGFEPGQRFALLLNREG